MGDNPFEEPSSGHNQRLLNTGGSRSYGGSGGYQPKEVFGDSYVDAEGGGNEAYKPELQFQTFQHTTAQSGGDRGRISGSGGHGHGGSHGGGAVIHPDQSTVVDFEDDSGGKQPLSGGSGSGGGNGGEGNPPSDTSAPEPEPPAGSAKFWTVQYYRPLFNVDTAEVLQRIIRSLTPFRFGFIETAKTNPDFYGPFWISTTLIFLLAIAGFVYAKIDEAFSHHSNTPTLAPTFPPTLAPTDNSTVAPTGPAFWAAASSSSSSDDWNIEFNFKVIVVGACIIYGYTIVIPLILWGVFKYLSVPVKLLEIICIYGYTLFVFIPVSIVFPAVARFELLQWVLTMGASAWSGFFLVSNLLVTVKDIALKRGLAALLVVGALHLALGLTYKLYFFDKAVK